MSYGLNFLLIRRNFCVYHLQFEEVDERDASHESPADALVNSSTWLRKRAVKRIRWSQDATDRFYEVRWCFFYLVK